MTKLRHLLFMIPLAAFPQEVVPPPSAGSGPTIAAGTNVSVTGAGCTGSGTCTISSAPISGATTGNLVQAASATGLQDSGIPASSVATKVTNANFVFDGDSRTYGTGSTASPCSSAPCLTTPITGYIITTTGTASAGSMSLTVVSGTNTTNGDGVYGAGIAPGTTISSGGGTTNLTLSAPTVAALSGTTVSFGSMDYPSQAMRLPAFNGHGTGYNIGVGGQTCGQIAARYSTDAHTLSPSVTGNPGYFFLNCGTNSETAVTPTATGTSTQFTIVVSSVTGIETGDTVTGTGIGAGAQVALSWNGTTTVTLTIANSGTVSGTVTFTPSASSIAGAIANVWAIAKADGYTVIAITNPMHVALSSQRNLNEAYNNLVRSYRGFYTYIADIQAIMVDTYDTNFFYTDATHFTNEGYAVWAQAAAAALVTPGGERFGMPERRFWTGGSGSSNTRANDTCLYALTTGGNNTCIGYGSMPSVTTGNYNSAFGDNDLTGLIGGSANLAVGHGIGDNLVSGGSNVLIGGDTSGDSNFGVSIGSGCSVTGASAVCIGHNATAAGSALAIGGGTTASASGSVNIDMTGATTNSTANTFAYHGYSFLTTAGVITQSGATSCSLGVVTNSSGTFTGCVSSSEKLKTRIKQSNLLALPVIAKLSAYEYDWKDPKSRDSLRHYGSIAEKVRDVFPLGTSVAGRTIGIDPVALGMLDAKGIQELFERESVQQKEIDELKYEIRKMESAIKK